MELRRSDHGVAFHPCKAADIQSAINRAFTRRRPPHLSASEKRMWHPYGNHLADQHRQDAPVPPSSGRRTRGTQKSSTWNSTGPGNGSKSTALLSPITWTKAPHGTGELREEIEEPRSLRLSDGWADPQRSKLGLRRRGRSALSYFCGQRRGRLQQERVVAFASPLRGRGLRDQTGCAMWHL